MSKAHLVKERYGFNANTGQVCGFQWWDGFARSRNAVLTSMDGRRTSGPRSLGKAAAAMWWNRRAMPDGFTPVDVITARGLLGDAITATCLYCPGVVPIAGPWCPECGKSQDPSHAEPR